MEKMEKKKVIIGIICVLICELLFGFSNIFTKRITNLISPVTLLSWRFILAFIVLNLCVCLRIIKLNIKGKSIKPLLMIAIFQPILYFIGETFGIQFTTASESGTFIACIPIVTLICSALILKEKPNKWQIIGISITAIGIMCIVLIKGMEASFHPIGYFMLFLGVLSYSLYAVFSQKAADFTDIDKTYVMIALGAVFFTLIALIENGRAGTINDFILLPITNIDFLVAILYLGIGSSVLAFLLYNIAISHMGTNKTASFAGISTIVAILAGVIILNEPFSFGQLIGTVLVIGGVYIANINVDKCINSIDSTNEDILENEEII
ncbi:DMT family transporter [Anaerovorax sp. IOR16]|uniref:DMT family transporter n=1 Tax=Anaerovorax sp. IOR16 TaxID=2773458 RepID=UPI001FD63AF9|nr:DMT family transporter [Anaerovorax sp. IOR16]